jgi:hypothetical protein
MGCRAGPAALAGSSPFPESATEAVCVIIAWLAAWTILGAWRMKTGDARENTGLTNSLA